MHRETLEEDYEFEVSKNEEGGYSVSLPHQCDNWEILGANVDTWNQDKHNPNFTTDYPNLPKNKENSIKQMELFIKRANEALEKLKLL